MDWDFTDDIAFKNLYEAFKDNEETSATEFLASNGASYYLELIQNAAGEGIDFDEPNEIIEFQEKIIDYLENK